MKALFAGLSRREKKVLIFFFVVAWCLRIAVAVEYEHRHPLANRPVIDEASYERWALEIAAGDWLGDEVFFQEPLYPYWLASVYAVVAPADDEDRRPPGLASERQRTAVRHIQAFFGALTVVLAYRLTWTLFGGAAAALAAAALALYRPLLAFPSYLLKPNLFLPVWTGLLLAMVLLQRRGDSSGRGLWAWFGCGALAACAALLRGNALLLTPFFTLLAFLGPGGFVRPLRSRIPCAAALALGTGAVLGLVGLRNQVVGGVFALTTSGAGTNLHGGNNAENPYGVATELPWVRGIPEYELGDWTHEAERRTGSPMAPGEVSRFWLTETWASVRAEPLVHLEILLNKLRLSLGAYEVPDNHHLDWDARFVSLLRWPFPGYGLIGILGGAGALLFLGRRDGKAPVLTLGILSLGCAYLATIVLTVVSMRVRLALVPFTAIFAGYFLSRAPQPLGTWINRLGSATPGRTLGVARACALLMIAAVPVVVPVFDAEQRETELLERDFNHAVYLLEEPDGLGRAAAIADGLLGRFPGAGRVETLRAEIDYRRARVHLAEQGDAAEARSLLSGALRRLREVVQTTGRPARERFRARRLAGLIQLETIQAGSPSAEAAGPAVRHFRAALEFDPQDPLARKGLGIALYLSGQPAADRGALEEARGLFLELEEEATDADLRWRIETLDALLESTGDQG